MASMELFTSIWWVFFFFLAASAKQYSLSKSSTIIRVPIGGIVSVVPQDLYVFKPGIPPKDQHCKVQVIETEPISQRVGTMTPKIFDCDFVPRSVIYEHFGSPLLDEDLVKLRILDFTKNLTIQETIDVSIKISRKPYESVTVKQKLVVKEFFGLSRPIDDRVLKLKTETQCRIKMFSSVGGRDVPFSGQMIMGHRRLPVPFVDGLYSRSCKEFLHLGLRYEHLKPPTPNEDYVVLLIESALNETAAGIRTSIIREWIQLEVVIEPAFPNLLPTVSPNVTLLFYVQQDSLTTLSPTILSASDEESPPSHLVFNLTKGFSPFQGYLYHIDDPFQPVSSFTQEELVAKRISYCPPDELNYDKITFQIQFDIFDGNFGVNESAATLKVILRRVSLVHNKPRAFVRKGLILLEGQSMLILPHHLQLHALSPSARSSLIFDVLEGPRHGRLLVDRHPDRKSFTWSDVEQHLVVYEHDGSDSSTHDFLYLSIIENSSGGQVVLPIIVLPTDDSPPTLIVNSGLQVDEGGTLVIRSWMLTAVDDDSPPEEITYVVIRRQNYGLILLRNPWTSMAIPVSNFTQSDVDDGLLFYQHDGRKVYKDDFVVVLHDGHIPEPNISPPQVVSIAIVVLDDDPPRLTQNATLSAIVYETEVLFLTKVMLHYVSANGRNDDVVYTITTSTSSDVFKYSSSADAGKFVYVRRAVSGSKSELLLLPNVISFSQNDINRRRIAYVPSQEDVGSFLMPVSFNFNVQDRFGNRLHDQYFSITVLPVNNKPPILYTGILVAIAGNSTLISTHALSVNDEDTSTENLEIRLTSLPQYGAVILNHVAISLKSNFTMSDIISSKVRYSHRGTKSTNDRITVTVSDGVHNVSGSILVHILPANDDHRHLVVDPLGFSGLTVKEGDQIILSSDVIFANVDDVYDDNALFTVVENPHLGVIQVDGKVTGVFTHSDLMTGKVSYVHNGTEIGTESKLDDIKFRLVEDHRPSVKGRSGVDLVHTLNITILPVDNMAPRLESLSTIKVSEGGKAAIGLHMVNIQDLDSTMQNVAFVISRQPSWGYLESARLSSASETGSAPVRINSFRLVDLTEETIHYVQSEHRGVEPVEDFFLLYATDGIHRSEHIVFNITIIPMIDEAPVVMLRNFTVSKGSNKLLDTEILNITDLDTPADVVLVQLEKPPHHGRIMVDVEENLMLGRRNSSRQSLVEFSELDWVDFERFEVIYQQDGISSEMDNFTLMITDGLHFVSRVSLINVTSESGHLRRLTMTNHGLKGVVVGDVRFISNTVLNLESASTPNYHILYRITRVPRQGVLQFYRLPDSWMNATRGSIFTQQDIDSLSLRYLHTDKNLGDLKDDFAFVYYVNDSNAQVSDVKTFYIEIKSNRGTDITLAVETVEVDAGGRASLGPSVIRIGAGANNAHNVMVRVTVPPSSGRVVHLKKPQVAATNFTLSDILSNQVVYIHEPSASGSIQSFMDRFRISVFRSSNEVDAAAVADVTVHFRKRVDDDVAKVNRYFREPLVVPLDGMVPLRTDSHANANTNVTYTLTEPPKYGVILVDGHPLTMFGSSFSQKSVDEGRVVYQRQPNTGLTSDRIHFQVTVVDSRNSRFQRIVDKKEIRLDVVVDGRKQFAFRLDLMYPKTLENFDDGFQGFKFTDNHIRTVISASDVSLTDVARTLRYVVQKLPKHGRLEKWDGTSASVVTEFSLEDVEKKRIRYVIVHSTAQTPDGDQFDLSIVDSMDRVLAMSSMELRWSVIYFMQTEYEVCEDVGTISVLVSRSSNLEHSSFVEIGAAGGTARQGQDYWMMRVRQLHFYEGMTSISWDIVIENDNFREVEVETIIVLLRNPVNAVIKKHSQVTIKIHEKDAESCINFGYLRPTSWLPGTTSTTTSKPSLSAVCNSNTVGAPLSVTFGSSSLTLICDGNTWVSLRQTPVLGESETSLANTTPTPLFRHRFGLS